MIALALTFPTPGSASSSAETLSLPIASSVFPSWMTADNVVWPYFRRFFTAARVARAAAAFSKAADRCSGVRGGRATVSPRDLGRVCH
jgi:hypothetical protein